MYVGLTQNKLQCVCVCVFLVTRFNSVSHWKMYQDLDEHTHLFVDLLIVGFGFLFFITSARALIAACQDPR